MVDDEQMLAEAAAASSSFQVTQLS